MLARLAQISVRTGRRLVRSIIEFQAAPRPAVIRNARAMHLLRAFRTPMAIAGCYRKSQHDCRDASKARLASSPYLISQTPFGGQSKRTASTRRDWAIETRAGQIGMRNTS